MGRNTHEVGLKEGFTNPYPPLRQYVFSKTMRENPDPNVKLVSGDPVEKVRAFKQEPGRAIWLCGGAALAGTLYKAGLIDQPPERPDIQVCGYNREPNADILLRLNRWIERGPFQVHIAHTFPLEQAAEAHRALE